MKRIRRLLRAALENTDLTDVHDLRKIVRAGLSDADRDTAFDPLLDHFIGGNLRLRPVVEPRQQLSSSKGRVQQRSSYTGAARSLYATWLIGRYHVDGRNMIAKYMSADDFDLVADRREARALDYMAKALQHRRTAEAMRATGAQIGGDLRQEIVEAILRGEDWRAVA